MTWSRCSLTMNEMNLTKLQTFENNFQNILNVISDDKYGHLMSLELGKMVMVKIIFLQELSVLESSGTESR